MLNEQKVTYKMKTLIESGFFGNKGLISEALADKDRIRLFQAAYNYTYDKNLAVDGIKGVQTDAAIAEVKKQLGKDKLDDEAAKDFYQKFLVKLEENKATINIGQGGANTNKKLNQAIQTLINLAGTPIVIDGVVGTNTIAAIRTLTDGDSEVINSETITLITGKAVKNILQLGVEDIATVKTDTKDSAENTGGTKSKFGTCLSGNCENGQGKLKGDNGNTYIGTFINFLLTGKENEIQYANGNIFKGETSKGYPIKGTTTYKDGSVFTGDYNANSSIRKNGNFKSFEGWTYIGTFTNTGKMEGTNSLYINKNGKQFKLDFKSGKPIGTTWQDLDSRANDKLQSILSDAGKKEGFNKDMKKLVDIIKTNPNKSGKYEIKSKTDMRFYDSKDAQILKTGMLYKELLSMRFKSAFWEYKSDTNSIVFTESVGNQAGTFFTYKIV